METANIAQLSILAILAFILIVLFSSLLSFVSLRTDQLLMRARKNKITLPIIIPPKIKAPVPNKVFTPTIQASNPKSAKAKPV